MPNNNQYRVSSGNSLKMINRIGNVFIDFCTSFSQRLKEKERSNVESREESRSHGAIDVVLTRILPEVFPC